MIIEKCIICSSELSKSVACIGERFIKKKSGLHSLKPPYKEIWSCPKCCNNNFYKKNPSSLETITENESYIIFEVYADLSKKKIGKCIKIHKDNITYLYQAEFKVNIWINQFMVADLGKPIDQIFIQKTEDLKMFEFNNIDEMIDKLLIYLTFS